MSDEETIQHPYPGWTVEEAAAKQHDLDLGDGHWLDWSTYQGVRCGAVITHAKSPELLAKQQGGMPDPEVTVSTLCESAITIRGSNWDQAQPNSTSWEFNGNFEKPTFTPSFLCHCGDHGFITDGKWVRA